MKKLVLILGLIISFMAMQVVLAQPAEGTITYVVKVNMHKTLPPDRAEMKEMIPEFNTYRNLLVFREGESFFKTLEEEDDEEFGDQDGPVRLHVRRPQNEYYFNYVSGRRITLREFFGKNYLIEDSIKILPWKLSTETKLIQGYSCKKATWFDQVRNQNVTAWYAESLKPFFGPEEYNSLPGTILEVDINDGERIITVEKITPGKLDKNDLVIPTKGQRTTEDEFRKMMEEQRKRMGGQGNIIIRN
jgi:GLPGLI family protein